jgi:hypothetical protein
MHCIGGRRIVVLGFAALALPGDGVTDRLRYDEDRYFRTVDGATGAKLRSRHRM